MFRDELKRHYNTGQFWLNIDVDDVASFDQSLAEKLLKQPSEHITLVGLLKIFTLYMHFNVLYVIFNVQFESAAKEIADEVTRPRPEGDEELQDIQVTLTSGALASSFRNLKVSSKCAYRTYITNAFQS